MIEYLNEDCMVGMARYPDKHFDLAIVDPPYGIGNWIPQCGSVPNKYNKAVEWNNERPTDDYFGELRRVSKNRIIWGANYYNCFEEERGAIVWFKQVANPWFSKCEIASTTTHKRVEYVHILWQNITRENNEERWHPCTKPVALYKWLLKNYAKQGDKILDTHVGSASSLIACYDMGFDAVGFELDADYYKASKQRLDDFIRQPKITECIDQFEQIRMGEQT
jgi:site-specific DNA-methyltransferase (adenine-specific)